MSSLGQAILEFLISGSLSQFMQRDYREHQRPESPLPRTLIPYLYQGLQPSTNLHREDVLPTIDIAGRTLQRFSQSGPCFGSHCPLFFPLDFGSLDTGDRPWDEELTSDPSSTFHSNFLCNGPSYNLTPGRSASFSGTQTSIPALTKSLELQDTLRERKDCLDLSPGESSTSLDHGLPGPMHLSRLLNPLDRPDSDEQSGSPLDESSDVRSIHYFYSRSNQIHFDRWIVRVLRKQKNNGQILWVQETMS